MTETPLRPRVSLLRTLFLWGARWTAGLGLIGIATYGRNDLNWIWAAGVILALGDLFITLLKEARLADKRARSRNLMSELTTRLGEDTEAKVDNRGTGGQNGKL